MEHDSAKSSEEMAHGLFDMLDHDGSGEITSGEFKSTLDSFNLNFTLEEVGDIVRELDKNSDGMIGIEEFEEMLERFKVELFEDEEDGYGGGDAA
jgi:Ca2+-binding EF-hand superfamily protein